ncbi:MAG: hypothetical protein ACP5UU_05710 [Thermoprotei archaeon]
MRKPSAFVLWIILLLSVVCISPAKGSSINDGMVQLTYEGTAAGNLEYDQNFFFKGQQATFNFTVSGVSNVTFYLVPFMSSRGYVPVCRTAGPGSVSFSVNTSSLPIGLYQIVARAGSQEWDGVSSPATKDYQENPWLLAVIQRFNATWNFSGLPPLTIPYGLGINVHFSYPNAQDLEYLRMMSYAGVKLVRTDLFLVPNNSQSWSQQLSPWYNLAVAEAIYGIRPLFILDGNPLRGVPANTSTWDYAYANYAGNASLIFAKFNPIFEIWNEPNAGGAGYGFWGLYPEQAYSNAATAAIMRMEAATGDKATIIAPAAVYLGGTSNLFIEKFAKQLSPEAFRFLAAFSVHPYRNLAPETASQDYISLKENLSSENKTKPIVESEWGYGSLANGMLGQAEYYSRIYLTNLMNGIPVTILYEWQDGTASSWGLTLNENVLRLYGGPLEGTAAFMIKPAYFALYYLDYSLHGYTFSESYLNGHVFTQNDNGTVRYVNSALADESGVFFLKFVNGNLTKYVIWTDSRSSTFVLTPKLLGEFSSVNVTTLFGYQTTYLPNSSDEVNVPVTGLPEILTVAGRHHVATSFPSGYSYYIAATVIIGCIVIAAAGHVLMRRHHSRKNPNLQG